MGCQVKTNFKLKGAALDVLLLDTHANANVHESMTCSCSISYAKLTVSVVKESLGYFQVQQKECIISFQWNKMIDLHLIVALSTKPRAST